MYPGIFLHKGKKNNLPVGVPSSVGAERSITINDSTNQDSFGSLVDRPAVAIGRSQLALTGS